MVTSSYCHSFHCTKIARYLCSACKSGHYCCRTCQKTHWKHNHKYACKIIQNCFEILNQYEIDNEKSRGQNDDKKKKRKREEEGNLDEEQMKRKKLLQEAIVHTDIIHKLPNELILMIGQFLDAKEKNIFNSLTKDLNEIMWASRTEITIKNSLSNWVFLKQIPIKMNINYFKKITLNTNEFFKYKNILYLFPDDSKLKISDMTIILDKDYVFNYNGSNILNYFKIIPQKFQNYIKKIKIENYYIKNILPKIGKTPLKLTQLTELSLLGRNYSRSWLFRGMGKDVFFTCDILDNFNEFSIKLEKLKLRNLNISKDCFLKISQFTALKSLDIGFMPLNPFAKIPPTLNYLSSLINLSFLTMREIEIKESSINELSFLIHLTNLKALNFKGVNEIQERNLIVITNLKKLEIISFVGGNLLISGMLFKYILELSTLSEIEIKDTYEKLNFLYLKNNSNIRKLTLQGVGTGYVYKDTLSNIGTLINLEYLDMNFFYTDTISFLFSNKKPLEKMKYLNISYLNRGNIGIWYDLPSKNVVIIPIEDIVEYMPNLEKLIMNHTKVRSKDFRNLSSLKNLKYLQYLYETDDKDYIITKNDIEKVKGKKDIEVNVRNWGLDIEI